GFSRNHFYLFQLQLRIRTTSAHAAQPIKAAGGGVVGLKAGILSGYRTRPYGAGETGPEKIVGVVARVSRGRQGWLVSAGGEEGTEAKILGRLPRRPPAAKFALDIVYNPATLQEELERTPAYEMAVGFKEHGPIQATSGVPQATHDCKDGSEAVDLKLGFL
ncbi:hypothetical protein J1605_005020, partial [Eschrichtius robustus]